MKKIVFASTNVHKIVELNALLKNTDVRVIPQADLQIAEVPETASTFIENALIKARHAAEQSGLPALADDSGLVVPFLGGAPGIYSARYAGSPSDAKANIKKLLGNLADCSGEKRHAYYYCVLVLIHSPADPTPIICEGVWHGQILTLPQGANGFGYDPIFYDAEMACSAAELSLVQKNALSHRSKALTMLLDKLQSRS